MYETLKEKEKDRKATAITATTATTTTAIKGVVMCNVSKNISLKLKKMAKNLAIFLHVLTASIREMRQKTFKLAIFLGPVVKHNRNGLQY